MQIGVTVAIVALAAIYMIWRAYKVGRSVKDGHSPCAHCLANGGCCRDKSLGGLELIPVKASGVRSECGCSGQKVEKTASF